MAKRKPDKKVRRLAFRIEDARQGDFLRAIAKKEPGSVIYSFERGKAFVKMANGSVATFDMMKTNIEKIRERAKEEYRKSKL